MEKILKYIWLGLAIMSMIAAIGFGAWHHLLTCGLCTIMYLAMGDDQNEAA
jgi:hypothetical protein